MRVRFAILIPRTKMAVLTANLTSTVETLLEKGTLLHSDIKAIRDSVTIVEVDV